MAIKKIKRTKRGRDFREYETDDYELSRLEAVIGTKVAVVLFLLMLLGYLLNPALVNGVTNSVDYFMTPLFALLFIAETALLATTVVKFKKDSLKSTIKATIIVDYIVILCLLFRLVPGFYKLISDAYLSVRLEELIHTIIALVFMIFVTVFVFIEYIEAKKYLKYLEDEVNLKQ